MPTAVPTFYAVDPLEYRAFGDDANVVAAAFSADHTKVAFGDFDSGQLAVWDLTNWKQVSASTTWPFLTAVAFSSDGDTVATGHRSGGKNEQTIIVLLNPLNGTELHRFYGFANVSDLAFVPNHESLAVAESGVPIVYSLEDEYPYRPYQTSESTSSVAVSPDGMTMAAGMWDGKISMWSIAENKLLDEIPGRETSAKYRYVKTLIFSPDGTHLASSAADNTVTVWDTTTGGLMSTAEFSATAQSLAYSSNGKALAIGTEDGVYLWVITSGDAPCQLSAIPQSIVGVDFVAEETTIAAVTRSGVILAWNIAQACSLSIQP